MTSTALHAVFLFPAALEALGEPIKPYLSETPRGLCILCREIDTGGAFVEVTLEGTTAGGHPVEVELMLPANMVRMVVSSHSEAGFGFQQAHESAVVASRPVGAAAIQTAPTAVASSFQAPSTAGDEISQVEG
ncbi:MAG: hypothetical protein JSR34_11345 [Proteobacteria bacterium]|nr:hypothetical protein [Pseudomonadota bacterium]